MPPTKHCHEPQSELVPTAKVQPPKVDATVAVYLTGCLGRKTPIAKPPKTNNARFTQIKTSSGVASVKKARAVEFYLLLPAKSMLRRN